MNAVYIYKNTTFAQLTAEDISQNLVQQCYAVLWCDNQAVAVRMQQLKHLILLRTHALFMIYFDRKKCYCNGEREFINCQYLILSLYKNKNCQKIVNIFTKSHYYSMFYIGMVYTCLTNYYKCLTCYYMCLTYYYTPTTKCRGVGYNGFALSRPSVHPSISIIVSATIANSYSYTNGRIFFKLYSNVQLNKVMCKTHVTFVPA